MEMGDSAGTELTLIDVIERLFPIPRTYEGEISGPPYVGWPLPDSLRERFRVALLLEDNDPIMGYAAPPQSPFDLFAIAAHLLEISGAYHHISTEPPGPAGGHGRTRAERNLQIKREDRLGCASQAEIWRRNLNTLDAEIVADRAVALAPTIEAWLDLLTEHSEAKVYVQVDENMKPPAWWHIAWQLLAIADGAAKDIGFETLHVDAPSSSWPWFMRIIEANAKEVAKAGVLTTRNILGEEDLLNRDDVETLPVSLSGEARDVVCVLPKARTAPIGCTLRSLTHNLALLPARGIARARWTPPIHRGHDSANVRPPKARLDDFNLLLVPFPYSISAREFDGNPDFTQMDGNWSFFEVKQTWRHGYGGRFSREFIGRMIAELVGELARKAKAQGAPRIDAVVFPELALDHRIFGHLRTLLPVQLPELQLLIAGLSSYDRPGSPTRHGNFVGVTVFSSTRPTLETIREKHHRWMLNKAQIEAYRLEGRLDPRCNWWEDIDLLSRRVDFTVFQDRSVLAAMICEDLARVDPCQELLRAIGPNLVVALLMDAPQLPTRWPARYATILAEDPGSSVLTLTSRGLITRQALEKTVPEGADPVPVIALWRDNHHGRPMPIKCPFDAHGVWLRLWGRTTSDMTLDGRTNPDAMSWIWADDQPLVLADIDSRFASILGPEDREVRRRAATSAAAADRA